MDNYSELIRNMAEAFVDAVRALETENAKLRSENELLALELKEAKEGNDQFVYYCDADWAAKFGKEASPR